MTRIRAAAVIAVAAVMLAGCPAGGPREGQLCNHAGDRSGDLVCKRNRTTGPLVWRKA